MLAEVGTPNLLAFRAWFHAEAGEADEARRLLETPGVLEDIAERRWYMFWGDTVGLASAAALLGDLDRCRRLRELMSPYRANAAVLGLAAFLGSVAHHCGVLSGALGEWDAAVGDLEAGLAAHRAMGARPWVALSEVELARVLDARGAPGDHDRAAELRAAARLTADQLGLTSVHLRLHRAIGGPPT
jgi:ATP/maltotriose-dependent transcriptional regulator MalT